MYHKSNKFNKHCQTRHEIKTMAQPPYPSAIENISWCSLVGDMSKKTNTMPFFYIVGLNDNWDTHNNDFTKSALTRENTCALTINYCEQYT